NSTNLKIDFAASKYPIPSKKPMIINNTTKSLSIIPITFPAFLSDSFLRVFFLNDSLQFRKNIFIPIDVTEVIKSKAMAYNITFSSEITDTIESSGNCRSEEHTSELQSRENLVCRLLLEKKKDYHKTPLIGRQPT